jgi:hypothetical protein
VASRLQPRLPSVTSDPIQHLSLARDMLRVVRWIGRHDGPFRVGFGTARHERDLVREGRHRKTMRPGSLHAGKSCKNRKERQAGMRPPRALMSGRISMGAKLTRSFDDQLLAVITVSARASIFEGDSDAHSGFGDFDDCDGFGRPVGSRPDLRPGLSGLPANIPGLERLLF